MLKEIKIIIYIISIFLFLFFCIKYYFSDDFKKKSFRIVNTIDKKILMNNNTLIILKNDTDNIIEYIAESNNDNEKEFKFFELLNED